MTEAAAQRIFASMVGQWKGGSQTWFNPNELSDESEVRGEFSIVIGGRFLRHTYEGSMQGKPRQGEELIAFNSVTNQFQSSWVDDFHMSYAILFSEGPAIENGFAVTGEYDVAPGEPRWGWRTEYQLKDPEHLTITAFNITPAGEEAKAVELHYERVR